ncbi:cell wall-binding repeat-containing protein [Clostridium sp. P21]|uniref:Cell wall-binding repeat-containing protein n=1 Tax=Clostridium muellerianum TaxID=2716538 RepID=A0A7Y0HPK6_9CLOT|nr:cell wall-binding repeat-containing protein [Clostridium muellerianum]NMM65144.1 cell wall-binding repeat-containing protein [Clostridium muellerianum]
MEVNSTKALKSAAVMSLVLAAALSTSPVRAAEGQVTAVGGTTIYETAAKVATTNWTSSKNVVLVCGEGYADAVSGSALAKQLDAPILLTTTETLNSYAKTAMDTLKPQNVYVIGGTASVAQSVRDGLKNSNYNLIELGGKDRYETNVAVANQLVKLGVNPGNVMLVGGEGFSDVLSVTPVAAAKGQILLLGINDNKTLKPVLDFVKTNNSNVTVVGTKNSISDSTYKTVGATKRVDGGTDRFETNLKVLNEFKDDLKTSKLYIANASGDRYADALIASSLAGKWSSPLVLVDQDNSTATNKAADYIKNKATSSTDVNAIAETGVISDNVISKINSSIPLSSSPTVKSVTTNGLNQVRVVFNTEVDENTAKAIRNYQIDGEDLGRVSETDCEIYLEDDKRTVAITFEHPFNPSKTVAFTVKNAILDRTTNKTIDKYEKDITFSVKGLPILQSVKARGGNKLIVKFSQPIKITSSDLSSMKINRQSLLNFGLNTSETKFIGEADHWCDNVELYFDSPLPIGSNTFVVPNGDSDKKLYGAGNFPLEGSSLTFDVDTSAGTPKVTDVSADDSGVIYITYDRTMDQKTALEYSNYKINGSTVGVSSSNICFEPNTEDKVVKIKGLSYLFKNGQNTLTVNDDVQDTYGNLMNEQVKNFNINNDTSKPKVINAALLDNKTLRVKFNKDVSNGNATNKSNYKIVDSSGMDVTYKIDYITSVEDADGNSNRTYNIKFEDSERLKDSEYTLTVKNIMDTASVPNVMEPYTTKVDGVDTDGVAVDSVIKNVSSQNQVVVFFNKVMDENSITNSSNYRFMDGTGEGRDLPSSTVITASADNKSVTIEFPSSYVIGDSQYTNYVKKISVSNVKDKNGNSLTSTYSGEIQKDYTNGPKLIDNTAKLTFENDDIVVRFSLTDTLDIINAKDFRVDGQTPDRCSMSGKDVTLTFRSGIKNNDKINSIKNAGADTTLYVYGDYSVDAAGRKLQSGSDKVLIPPITRPDSWFAETNRNTIKNPSITIAFNQNIDDDIRSSYYDDFIFTNETTGQTLTPLSLSVDGHNVIYDFNRDTIRSGDKVTVRANPITSSITIRGEKTDDGDYAVFSPCSDDLKPRTLIAK